MTRHSMDIQHIFTEKWNQKLRSIRIAGVCLGVLMVICAGFCVYYPYETMRVLQLACAMIVLLLGVYQLVDFYFMPILLRDAGTLIGGVLNLVIGMMLLFSPMEITVSAFAYMFGFILMVFGVNKITFANKLHFFAVSDYGWVIGSGILNIAAAAAFLIMPMVSTVFLQYVLAGYLFIGGLALLIEVAAMKNMKLEDA